MKSAFYMGLVAELAQFLYINYTFLIVCLNHSNREQACQLEIPLARESTSNEKFRTAQGNSWTLGEHNPRTLDGYNFLKGKWT